jgi:acyl-CoA synthetase (NDP forming)
MFNEKRISRILTAAIERHESVLLETDGFEILKALGFKTCSSLFVRNADDVRDKTWKPLSGNQVVVKVVSQNILHKSDVGGVAVVANDQEAIASAIETMAAKLRGIELAGFSINQFIEYDAGLGGELLLGLRRTDDFGPVVTVGAGGIYTEFLTENFKPGRDVAILSTELTESEPGAVATGSNTQLKSRSVFHDSKTIASALSDIAIVRLITNPPRGQQPRIQFEELVAATNKLLWLGRNFGHLISEFEINPLVIADGELIALDVLIKVAPTPETRNGRRPVEKLKYLLEPQSAAVIGVSEKLNPGHVIVNNLLREGFDRNRLYVVKPGTETLEGCACYADVASLPERVDLLVVSVAAAQVPETVSQVIETRKAESIVVIPGGLEEKNGSELLTSRLHAVLSEARATDWHGPLINGGNCLGIRSRPGRYDTMFIPQHKLSGMGVVPPVESRPGSVTAESRAGCACPSSPVAMISQSGAFALAKADKLAGINPKYNISLGNQMDLTVGDYLAYLKDDAEIEVFAVYVEGFAKLDGIKFLKAAEEIVAGGRAVILYRAGRTPAGANASASHTASIAGAYAVTRSLAKQAGVIVAESLSDFEDLTQLFTLLLRKQFTGRRLGAISNAGFECVAMADSLGNFTLPKFSERAMRRLRTVFERCRIDQVVDAHNPLDLTPMADDGAYEEAVLAVMEDENVDVGIVGCVPMTPALNTLAPGEGHREDIDREESVVQRLLRLNNEIKKPWVAVVDAGTLYDPMAARLQAAGIPTFRTADRALRLLNLVCEAKGRSLARG